MERIKKISQRTTQLFRKRHTAKDVEQAQEKLFEVLKTIDRMIDEGNLAVNILTGMASISSADYITVCAEAKKETKVDETFKRFIRNLRLWTNYQRAYKLGDIEAQADAGDITPEQLEEAKARFSKMPDKDSFSLVVTGSDGNPIVAIEENTEFDTLRYHIIDEKKRT